MLNFFTAELSPTGWKDTIWMGCSLGWVLGPGSSLVREWERTWFRETQRHLLKNSHRGLANEKLRWMNVLHRDRLNAIRPSHYLLAVQGKVWQLQERPWGCPTARWLTRHRVECWYGIKEKREQESLGETLATGGPKKQEQTLGQIVWLNGAGDNCVLKIPWGIGSE